MITRVWRAEATNDGYPRYREHFERNVLPALRALTGFQGAFLLTRQHDEATDIEVHTLWDSMDAVRAFAGPDVERAVVEPQAQAALIDYGTTVVHFETVRYAGKQG